MRIKTNNSAKSVGEKDFWTERRLEELALETGMSVRETRDVQLEENRTGKFRRYLRNIIDIALQFSLPISTAAIVGAAYMGNEKVVDLDRYDVNRDGIEDVIGIFPIKGTHKGIVGYIDGRDVKGMNNISNLRSKGINTAPNEYDVLMFWNFKPIGLQFVNASIYNHWQMADFIYVEKDKKGNAYLMEAGEFTDSTKIARIRPFGQR